MIAFATLGCAASQSSTGCATAGRDIVVRSEIIPAIPAEAFRRQLKYNNFGFIFSVQVLYGFQLRLIPAFRKRRAFLLQIPKCTMGLQSDESRGVDCHSSGVPKMAKHDVEWRRSRQKNATATDGSRSWCATISRVAILQNTTLALERRTLQSWDVQCV